MLVELVDGKAIKRVLPIETNDDEKSKSSSYVCAISWNKTGTRIYAGTSKGYLNIIDPLTMEVSSNVSPNRMPREYAQVMYVSTDHLRHQDYFDIHQRNTVEQ